jgi:hypothetical protein
MENSPKSRSEWFALAKEFEQSKTTQINFCKQKGIIRSRFTYYVQIYRKDINPTPKETPSFSQVVVNQPLSSSQQEIKIELPNGFRCQIPLNISSEALKKLIGALLSC